MAWFDGFELKMAEVAGLPVCFRQSADWAVQSGLPVLVLLHGFPQTHVMWHRVAQALRGRYRMVLPDLRGYGGSSHAVGDKEHLHYSKRSMAQEVVGLLDLLGVGEFFLCGHDRGGRVAHRLALDHASRVRKLCVMDIAPTLDMYSGNWGKTLAATGPVAEPYFAFAQAYDHWFHLTQPPPLPEYMVGGQPRAYLHSKLGGWGSKGMDFIEPEALAEYERAFCDTTLNSMGLRTNLHSMCEDYRASASIDLQHDHASREGGEKIACDTLVLWGERGVVHRMFDPLALWQAQCAGAVRGQVMPTGHFIPEELPDATGAALIDWMV